MEKPGILAQICHHCPLCRYARNNPDTNLGKLMAWHGKWCPAWKAYEKAYGQEDKKSSPMEKPGDKEDR